MHPKLVFLPLLAAEPSPLGRIIHIKEKKRKSFRPAFKFFFAHWESLSSFFFFSSGSLLIPRSKLAQKLFFFLSFLLLSSFSVSSVSETRVPGSGNAGMERGTDRQADSQTDRLTDRQENVDIPDENYG